MPIFILGNTSFPVDGQATFSASAASSVRGQVRFAAQQPRPVSGRASFQVQAAPIGSGSGDPVEYRATLAGLPGAVLAWEYSLAGAYEELSVTVTGQYGLDTPAATVQAEAYQGDLLLGSLPPRSFVHFGQEPQVDVGANTTQFRFRNSFDQALRGTVLDELIPWKLHPTPDCAGVRQKVSISQTVQDELSRATGNHFMFIDPDPLTSATWEEGRRDFSTANLTPQALWEATYGALGMVLWVMPVGTELYLAALWPNPVREGQGSAYSDRWVLSRQQGRELLQTPKRLTVRGADEVTELTPQKLLEWVGAGDPAYQEIAREVLPDAEWYEPPESSGTSRVYRGYRKSAGQIVASIEITTDDVVVKETVDGEPFERLWQGVGTGYKHTTTTFDPACPSRPLMQQTVTKAWAFDAQTQGGTYGTTGPALYHVLQVGDLAADEDTTVIYTYSPQGYATSRTTNTRRLASLKQSSADSTPQDRGPLMAREYVTTTQTETWRPTGGGRWLYTPGVSAQTLVPVYDADSGEAVRTASLTRSSPETARVTDQAPPSYACQTCAEKEVRDATGLTLRVGDAGFGEERTLNLNFLDAGLLRGVAYAAISSDWNRVIGDISLPFPALHPPGTWADGGRVRSLRMSQQGDGPVQTSLTTARLDTLFGPPSSAVLEPLKADWRGGRGVMLSAVPGGATVRVVTGWDASQNEAVTEKAFVRFRSGFPPRPGDEIDWEMVNGQREARSAR